VVRIQQPFFGNDTKLVQEETAPSGKNCTLGMCACPDSTYSSTRCSFPSRCLRAFLALHRRRTKEEEIHLKTWRWVTRSLRQLKRVLPARVCE